MINTALNLISPYFSYLKIGAWLALSVLIGWLYIQKGYYEGKYLTAAGKVAEQNAKLDAWESSNLRLVKYVHTQNKAIDQLRTEKNEAENKRLEAIKKARPRVVARQALINKPPVPGDGSVSCDDAVAKAISDLDGSSL